MRKLMLALFLNYLLVLFLLVQIAMYSATTKADLIENDSITTSELSLSEVVEDLD